MNTSPETEPKDGVYQIPSEDQETNLEDVVREVENMTPEEPAPEAETVYEIPVEHQVSPEEALRDMKE